MNSLRKSFLGLSLLLAVPFSANAGVWTSIKAFPGKCSEGIKAGFGYVAGKASSAATTVKDNKTVQNFVDAAKPYATKKNAAIAGGVTAGAGLLGYAGYKAYKANLHTKAKDAVVSAADKASQNEKVQALVEAGRKIATKKNAKIAGATVLTAGALYGIYLLAQKYMAK